MARRTDRTWLALRMVVTVILAGPLLWAAWASLQPIDRIFNPPASLVATDAAELPGPQWRNYAVAVTRLPFLRFLANSALIAGAATLGTVLTSSMAGFAFARFQWPGRGFCFVVLLACIVIPSQVLLVPQFLLFQHLGWVNTYKPLIVPSWLASSAFCVFLFRQFFRGIPASYEDAARLDGATHWQLYWNIMLPMSKPVIGAVAALTVVYHWQAFMPPLVYLSDFERFPVSVGLRMYQSVEGSWANLILAASLVALAPPLFAILIAHRYLMRSVGASNSP